MALTIHKGKPSRKAGAGRPSIIGPQVAEVISQNVTGDDWAKMENVSTKSAPSFRKAFPTVAFMVADGVLYAQVKATTAAPAPARRTRSRKA